MKFAAVLSKTMERQTETTTAADVFNAATLGGARAIGRDDLGRIAVGAKADLLLFDAESTWLVPLRDPIKNVVYSGQASDVHTVMVNGKIVMREGTVLTVDERAAAPGAPGGRRPDVVADGRPRLGQAARRRALAPELPGLDGVAEQASRPAEEQISTEHRRLCFSALLPRLLACSACWPDSACSRLDGLRAGDLDRDLGLHRAELGVQRDDQPLNADRAEAAPRAEQQHRRRDIADQPHASEQGRRTGR